MSSASTMWEVGAVVLGYVGTVASWRRPKDGLAKHNHGPMLTIQTCASTDEGVHEPAASITISSKEGLLALRDAIDEALRDPSKETTQ